LLFFAYSHAWGACRNREEGFREGHRSRKMGEGRREEGKRSREMGEAREEGRGRKK
jgi:hypothetical protein